MFTGELATAQYLNDESYHFEMVRWAVQQINEGHFPLDGWFPNLGLGFAQFHHYQSLPHIITAYLSLAFGSDATERWAAYLLLALFPMSVYAGSRLLGWSPWVAGCAALVSPLLVSVTGYGYEQLSYTWLGNGIWSQEWAMDVLPLAWGLSWRAVNGTGRATYALAALALALTIAMHFFTGYLALLSIGVFVIVVWRGLWRRAGRGVLVLGGAALVASWVVVPLIADSNFSLNSQFLQNTFWFDSYGAPQVLGWLFTGQVFDSGRFPIVSLLVALGTAVCLVRFRRDSRARALLGLMTLSLILWCGRSPFGFIINLLPGNADLQLQRYIMGVHLAGVGLAGVGLAWAGGLALRRLRAWRPPLRLLPITAGLIGVAVLITLPAWLDRAAYAQDDAAQVSLQTVADQTDGAALNVLIDEIKARGGGRTYAGLLRNWGGQYRVGDVPVYAYLANYDVDEVGFLLRTESLPTDNEAYFDEHDPAQYQLYNVRYILMPRGGQPPVPATLLATSGRHQLWQVATTGYLQVVDTSGIIAADRFDMANKMQPFLHSAAFHQGRLATVAFNGAAAATPTLPVGSAPTTSAGTSTVTLIQAQDGFFAATVHANRTAAVLLKASYDPRWRVTVDGRDATPYMVVPGFVAVTVGPGQHTVAFQYVSYPHYGLLLSIGGLTLLALALGPWLWRRWGARISFSGTASWPVVRRATMATLARWTVRGMPTVKDGKRFYQKRAVMPVLRAIGLRAAFASSTRWGLAALFAVGLAIRVWLAPQGGFPGDLIVHGHWEQQLASQDWSQFSDPTSFVYFPFLYVLYGLGQLTRLLFGTAPTWTQLKIPGIMADLALAWVTVVIAERLTPAETQRRVPVRGLAAAAILLNPAVFFISALWGQVDSIGALLVLGALVFLATGPVRLYRELIATVLFAAALEIKPQDGVVLPLLALVFVHRHLVASGKLDRRSLVTALARLSGLVAVGLAVIVAIPAPFGLDPVGVLNYYANAPTYAFTSDNAFNLWGLLGFWVPDLVGPNVYTVLGISAFWIGLALFAAGTAAILVRAWHALARGVTEGRVLVFGCAALTCLSFAVLTRVHERYLYLAIPCLAVFVAQRVWRRILAGLSILFLINIYFPYVFFVERYGQATFVKIDPLYSFLYGSDQDSIQKKILSLLTAAACLATAFVGWRCLITGKPPHGTPGLKLLRRWLKMTT
jgi:Gpi18-like mannosyltransferase